MNREEKKAQLKEHILNTTRELMKDKTIDNISAMDICQAASISKRTLYQYFDSKTDIYLQWVYLSFVKLNEILIKNIQVGKGQLSIKNICKSYIEFFLNNPFEGSLITNFNASIHEEGSSYLIKVEEIANDFEPFRLFKLLELDEGIFNETLAITIWSHLTGLVQLIIHKREWLSSYYKKPLTEIIEEQLDSISKLYEGGA